MDMIILWVCCHTSMSVTLLEQFLWVFVQFVVTIKMPLCCIPAGSHLSLYLYGRREGVKIKVLLRGLNHLWLYNALVVNTVFPTKFGLHQTSLPYKPGGFNPLSAIPAYWFGFHRHMKSPQRGKLWFARGVEQILTKKTIPTNIVIDNKQHLHKHLLTIHNSPAYVTPPYKHVS